jgi:hypothetical protein
LDRICKESVKRSPGGERKRKLGYLEGGGDDYDNSGNLIIECAVRSAGDHI